REHPHNHPRRCHRTTVGSHRSPTTHRHPRRANVRISAGDGVGPRPRTARRRAARHPRRAIPSMASRQRLPCPRSSATVETMPELHSRPKLKLRGHVEQATSASTPREKHSPMSMIPRLTTLLLISVLLPLAASACGASGSKKNPARTSTTVRREILVRVMLNFLFSVDELSLGTA